MSPKTKRRAGGDTARRPSIHLDAAAEDMGWDEYIDRVTSEISLLERRPAGPPRLTGAGLASLFNYAQKYPLKPR